MEASLAIAVGLAVAGALALETGLTSALLDVLAGVALALMLPAVGEVDWIHFLANLGMLALMFMAGFEVQTDRLRREWRACLGVGALSFAVPMAGIGAAAHWGFGLSWTASGLVALGLSTTSLALVYQSLKEMGLLASAAGQTLLGAASVTDLISMVALAAMMGEFGDSTIVFGLALVTLLIGLPRVGAWVMRRYRGAVVEPEVRFLLVVLVGMGFMAEQVGGIHPTVVAFATGIALSAVVEEHELLKHKLRGLVFGFFAPIFFLQAGTRLDPALLGPEALGIAAVLGGLAVLLKFAATALAVRGLFGGDGRLAGVLFNHRLTFGIVAASVGLEAGLLSGTLYAVMLTTILASSVAVAALLRAAGGADSGWTARAADRARHLRGGSGAGRA